MHRIILGLVLVALTAAPSWAARVRLRGFAASDRGPTVVFVVRLNVNTTTGAAQGPFVCHPGSARCLFGRGRVAAQFFSDGTFAGRVLSGRGSCNIVGSLAGNGVVGLYACGSVRGGDTGSFALGAF